MKFASKSAQRKKKKKNEVELIQTSNWTLKGKQVPPAHKLLHCIWIKELFQINKK